MRFLSQYPGFHPQIRPQHQRALGDGGVEVTQEPLYAKFTSIANGAFVYENEQTAALKHFTFHGNTQDEGESIPTDPLNRLSVLDTDEMAEQEGWSDEDKELVESRLLQLANDAPDQLLVVTETPITAPYPAYDRYDGDPQALMIKLIEDGHDLDKVLYYEQVFGPKRPEIIMWLEEAIEQRKLMEITA
jgi:hypothetical protein